MNPPLRKGSEKSTAISTSSVTAETQTAVKTASTATEREIAKAESAKAMQEEFGFQGEPIENRGSFDKSDRNLFEGQDLDVPTYLRKGIKITV